MDFHHLKIFTAVYRLRSFTGASKELEISQPTISEHIKNLERELSCRLFDRLGRTIMPTSQAELLFPRAQQLLDSLIDLRDDLTGSTELISGKITFGTSTIPGTYLIPAMAVEFKRKFPNATFEVIIKDTSKILEMILTHKIFCGIVGARHDSTKLEFSPFVCDELILVASKKLGLEEEIALSQLIDIPFLSREQGSGSRKCMEDYFTENKINPESMKTVASLGSTAAVKEAACQGLGATVLSKLAVEKELANGALQQVKLRGLKMLRDFYLVHHKQRTMPGRYQAFIRHLQH